MACFQTPGKPGSAVAGTATVADFVDFAAAVVVAATNPVAAEIEVAEVVVGVAAEPTVPGGAAWAAD